MHVLIAFLTTLASLLYALDRLGIDIGWLNPWSWARRRKWRKQYHANPAYSLTEPMEVAALLLTATAKIDGDISSEEKKALLRIFEDTFKQTANDASALFGSSVYLLGNSRDVYSRPEKVIEPCLTGFSEEQKTSMLELLEQIASVSDAPRQTQLDFIAKIRNYLIPKIENNSWA